MIDERTVNVVVLAPGGVYHIPKPDDGRAAWCGLTFAQPKSEDTVDIGHARVCKSCRYQREKHS